MNSDKIADLYSAGDISGFAYLACVDREIYTVEDAVTKGIFHEPCPSWAKEIESFVDKPSSELVEQEEQLDESSRTILWDKVKVLYNELLKDVDVRTASALKMIRMDYPGFKEFIAELLLEDGDFWVKFKSIRSIGRKSIQKAHEFIKVFWNGVQALGISYQSLFPPKIELEDTEAVTDIERAIIIRDVVQNEMAELSVRSCNALRVLLHDCDDSYTSFYSTIISPDFDVWQLRNVGRKSAPEITDYALRVQARVIDIINQRKAEKAREISEQGSKIPEPCLTSCTVSMEEVDYDSYKFFFEAKMHELSARSYHAVSNLYTQCGESVSKFIEVVSRSDFRITSLPAIGRKTANEISFWISSIRGFLLSGSSQIGDFEKEARTMRYSQRGMKGDVSVIESISSSLGYFALFAAIDQYLKQLPEREQTIIKNQLKIYTNQVLLNRKESAKLLGITPERMRQIRIAQFKKLSQYVHWLAKFKKDFSHHVYNREDIQSVNPSENTSFNDNFILWVISVVWHDEYKLFGDVDVAFANPYGYELNLALIPSSLTKIFDFKAFIQYFEELKDNKRTDDLSVPIRDIVLQFFKDRIYYESIEEIEIECRNLISKVVGFEIINDCVIIEKNAIRNNTEWVEIIIRETGHPLTIEEIFEELEKRQPGKSKSAIALSGAVRNNPNIVPIGRSSTYGLKEWTKGEHRGGTIREFATEYLLSLSMPIAPLEDIGKYVRQFRPSSSDKSIHANLLLEANGVFSLFYDSEDNRCIGLTNYDYGDSYRRYDPEHDSKRDFKTSCTLLERFVAEKGRLPFHDKGNEEEMRLCRFWSNQMTKHQKGQLKGEEAEIISSMIERLSKYKVNKNDLQWLNKYNTIKGLLAEGIRVTNLPTEMKQWLINQRRAFDSGRMPEDRVPKFQELIDLAQQHVNRI